MAEAIHTGITEISEGPQSVVKVVVQRCNSAELLVDNSARWIQVRRSLVVYVSFAEGANIKAVEDAVGTLLSVPLLSLGNWGEKDNKPTPLKKLVLQGENVGVLLIPQAGLVSKYKRGSLQYTSQLKKEESERLYYTMVGTMQRAVDEIKGNKEPWKPKLCVAPNMLFKVEPWAGQFSKFDDEHVPTHDNGGKPLSKSRRKKVLKVAEVNRKTYHAEQSESTMVASTSNQGLQQETTSWKELIGKNNEHDYVKFGTFGNLQSLRMISDLGPNTHVFNFYSS